MDQLIRDERFARHTFLVIDFETLTPAGRPAEPTEVAALALAVQGGRLEPVWRFESLIRPPVDVPVTAFDVAQTGITTAALRSAQPAAEVMSRLDGLLTDGPYRLVAHHAAHEAGLIGRQREHCPSLASTALLDTVKLARQAIPGLGSHRLDDLIAYYRIPKPADRHRAMPDVLATAEVLCWLLADGPARGRWNTLLDLDAAAGVQPKAEAREQASAQVALF